MTENSFWKALRKKLVPKVYALKLNVRYVAGVPDVWLSGSKYDFGWNPATTREEIHQYWLAPPRGTCCTMDSIGSP